MNVSQLALTYVQWVLWAPAYGPNHQLVCLHIEMLFSCSGKQIDQWKLTKSPWTSTSRVENPTDDDAQRWNPLPNTPSNQEQRRAVRRDRLKQPLKSLNHLSPCSPGRAPGRLRRGGQDYVEAISSQIDPDRERERGAYWGQHQHNSPNPRRVTQARSEQGARLWVSTQFAMLLQGHIAGKGMVVSGWGGQNSDIASNMFPYVVPNVHAIYFSVRRWREDTLMLHYLLMRDNLWPQGSTAEPLCNTLISDVHKTCAQFAFTFVLIPSSISCSEHECSFQLSLCNTRLTRFILVSQSCRFLRLCGYKVWRFCSRRSTNIELVYVPLGSTYSLHGC